MKKFQFIIICLFFWFIIFQNTYANTIQKVEIPKHETTMQVVGNKVLVDGDIEFKSYITIPYDLEVKGNIKFGESVVVLGNISATGDINAGNNLVVFKTLSAKNIFTGHRLIAKQLHAEQDIILKGLATVIQGVSAGGNFEAGSDLKLYGNSQIQGHMYVEVDTQIFGNLYVYESLRSKDNFHFNGGKLKIYGDFRTLQKSEVHGRIYIYGSPARRNYYTNKLKYTYILKNNKYVGFMGIVDPVLQYSLSDDQIEYIFSIIKEKEYNIQVQKDKIFYSGYKYSQDKISQEIKVLKIMEAELLRFISQYVSNHSRDIQEWKIIQFEREAQMQEFLYQYIY